MVAVVDRVDLVFVFVRVRVLFVVVASVGCLHVVVVVAAKSVDGSLPGMFLSVSVVCLVFLIVVVESFVAVAVVVGAVVRCGVLVGFALR